MTFFEFWRDDVGNASYYTDFKDLIKHNRMWQDMLKSYECTFPDTEDKLRDFIFGFNNGKKNIEDECAIEMLDLFYREVYPPPSNIEDY